MTPQQPELEKQEGDVPAPSADNKPDVSPPQEDDPSSQTGPEQVRFDVVIPTQVGNLESMPMVQFATEPGAHINHNHNGETEDVRRLTMSSNKEDSTG